MDIEACYNECIQSYGSCFQWKIVSLENKLFTERISQKIEKMHALFDVKMQCLAWNEAAGEFLLCTEHGQFVIIFLDEDTEQKIPAYKLFDTHQELKEYWIEEIQNSI